MDDSYRERYLWKLSYIGLWVSIYLVEKGKRNIRAKVRAHSYWVSSFINTSSLGIIDWHVVIVHAASTMRVLVIGIEGVRSKSPWVLLGLLGDSPSTLLDERIDNYFAVNLQAWPTFFYAPVPYP
jgi:hypothetical protein